MNKRPLPERFARVLHLEDNEQDQILVRELFEQEGLHCDFETAKSRAEFEAALIRGQFDLIISDFTLPSYDGSLALAAARRLHRDVPFIFFSGTIGEEIAVESLKIGATDFVIKERPGRLVAAVRRALHEAEDHKRREKAESALRENEERFRLIARATNDVIWERDFKSGYVWVGDNFQSVFGHDPQTVGTNSAAWDELVHPDDRQRVLSAVAGTIASGGRVWWAEFRLRRSDGSYAHVFSRAFVSYDENRQPARLVGATIDVTEHKLAKEKIQEQAALLDKASDAIIVCDLESRILFWNHGAEKLYGWKASEAIGQSTDALGFHEQPPETNTAHEQLVERGEWLGEIRQTTRSGREIVVVSRWTLVRDDEGNPKSRLIFNTDITEMKSLEDQLLRAQRMESLGVLVSGIAHDLNNALVPVIMGVGFLRGLPLPDQADDILDAMHASAVRGAEMLKSVLAFARGGEGKKEMVQLDQLVTEMCHIINDTFTKEIRCELAIETGSWKVFGIATQLHQVLMNLAVNARDAMPEGGVIHFSAKHVALNQSRVEKHPDARPGNYLCLSVSDAGVGIPPEQLDQIFKPFFTTKPPGKGTGLGLSTSSTIIKNHGGFMEVVSQPGHGTEFKIFLPESGTVKPVSDSVDMPAVALPTGSGETVLVVDAESTVLAIVKTTLENYGYQVLATTTAQEAVDRFTANQDAVQLVIADIAIKLADGNRVITALKKIKPGIRTILCGIEPSSSETTLRIRCDGWVTKPFTVGKLVTAVHEVLGKK